MCGKAVSEVLWTLVKSWDLLQGENCGGIWVCRALLWPLGGQSAVRAGAGGAWSRARVAGRREEAGLSCPKGTHWPLSVSKGPVASSCFCRIATQAPRLGASECRLWE